jgi:hypothetical protein
MAIKALAIESKQISAVGYWRCFEPLRMVQRLSNGNIDITFASEVTQAALYGYDVLIMFRPHEQIHLRLIETAKEIGLKVILDIDDDVWHLDPGHPLYLQYIDQASFFYNIYSLADHVWASTPQLQYATDSVDRGVVVYNAINPNTLPNKPKKLNEIVSWRGKWVQHGDLEYGKEQFEQVKTKYRWLFWGHVPAYDLNGVYFNAIQYANGVFEYFKAIQKSPSTMLWKPLKPGLFNDAKSNIALIEATMLGGVCVTNYAGSPMWETALLNFPDSESIFLKTWEDSVELIHDQYNIAIETEKRINSIMSIL